MGTYQISHLGDPLLSKDAVNLSTLNSTVSNYIPT